MTAEHWATRLQRENRELREELGHLRAIVRTSDAPLRVTVTEQWWDGVSPARALELARQLRGLGLRFAVTPEKDP